MQTAQLTVVEGPTLHLEQVFLVSTKGDRLLGRSSVSHFRLSDPLVSSLHCIFSWKETVFFVADLLSANGVFINDTVVDQTPLQGGDRIKVGKTILEFSPYEGKKKGKVYITGEEIDMSVHEDEAEEAQIAAEPHATGSQVPLGRMIKKSRDLTICRLALKNHLLQHEQIRQLLEVQKQEIVKGADASLADIVVAQKILQKTDIDKILQEHQYYKIRHKDIQFGKAIVEQKWAAPEKIRECLALQERYFKETAQMPRLGEILVQQNCISVQQNNRLIKAMLQKRQQD